MSRSRQPVPGFVAVLLSLLPAGFVFWLHLAAITALADVPAAAALFVQAANWMLTSAVVLGFWGAARMRNQVHDLAQRLAVALTDPVTGLAVRRVAEDAIVAAGSEVLLTVAVADVDRLHDINRGPGGYATGDRYLNEAGRRLRQAAIGDGDLVARLGGDEFVVITRRTPRQVADSLTAVFATPITVDAGILPFQVSVGICRLPGGDPHHLFGCADLAMLTAKRRRTRIEIYDAARDSRPLPPGGRPRTRRRSAEPAAYPGEDVLMPTMTVIDRDKLVTLIKAYGDARENGHGAAEAYGDIDGVLDNLAVGVGTLAAALNDAYAYRLGDDPHLEPIDAAYATTYADIARRLGIQLHA